MPALQLKRRFVEPVLSGRKRQTLRATLPGGCLAGARLTLLNGYRPGALVGHATIDGVDRVSVADLTAEDAMADGFAHLKDLHAELAQTYPAVRELWRVTWRDFSPAR